MKGSERNHWVQVFEILLCIVAAVVFVTALQFNKTRLAEPVSGYDGRIQNHQTFNKTTHP